MRRFCFLTESGYSKKSISSTTRRGENMSTYEAYVKGVKAQWNLANAVTTSRGLLGFVICGCILWSINPWITLALVLYGAISDGLDGWLARRKVGDASKPYDHDLDYDLQVGFRELNIPVDYVVNDVEKPKDRRTPLGEMFDPIADKLFVFPLLWLIAFQVQTIETVVLAGINTIYDVCRVVQQKSKYDLALRGKELPEKGRVTSWSKWKTALLFCFILTSVFDSVAVYVLTPFAIIMCVYIAGLLWNMFIHSKANRPTLVPTHTKPNT